MRAEHFEDLQGLQSPELENLNQNLAFELEEARAFSLDEIAAEISNCRGSCSQSSNSSSGCRSSCTSSCSRCSG